MDLTPAVIARVEGAVGVLELHRPDKFNCLSPQSHAELQAGLSAFERDAAVRAVLVCSTGRHFCTGADLDAVHAARALPGGLEQLLAEGHVTVDRLEASPLPVVVAVQGLCLAGGLELMLGADVAFAAEDAQFGDQHAAYGLVPGWGGSQRLPRIVGLRRAMDLFYTARRLDAATACAWGLVNHVVPAADLRQAALDYAQALAPRSASGLAAMKRLAREGLEQPLPDGLALERRLAGAAIAGADVAEGLQAFAERRAPRFAPRSVD